MLWKFSVTKSSGTPALPAMSLRLFPGNGTAVPTSSILSSLHPAWKRKARRWARPLPLWRFPRSCIYHIGLRPIGQDLIMWLQCKGGCEIESSFQVAMCSAKHLFLRKRRINTGINWLALPSLPFGHPNIHGLFSPQIWHPPLPWEHGPKSSPVSATHPPPPIPKWCTTLSLRSGMALHGSVIYCVTHRCSVLPILIYAKEEEMWKLK